MGRGALGRRWGWLAASAHPPPTVRHPLTPSLATGLHACDFFLNFCPEVGNPCRPRHSRAESPPHHHSPTSHLPSQRL